MHKILQNFLAFSLYGLYFSAKYFKSQYILGELTTILKNPICHDF